MDALFTNLLTMLRMDEPLPDRNSDHELIGNWLNHRECHIKPDLLLIYTKPDPDTLRLVRIGSHSDLFGK